jgi:hypothetical protein
MSAPAASFGPSASPLPAVTPKKKKLAAEPTPTKTVARKKPVTAEPVAVPEKEEVAEPPAKKVKKTKAAVEAEQPELVVEVDEVTHASGGKVKKAAKKKEEKPETVAEVIAPVSGGKVKKAAKKEEKADKGPKRALAAFMFYSNAVRAQTRLDNPTLKITEVASMLGKQWAELSEEAKKPYVAMHLKDKQRYDEEKAAAAK